jgi:hypothetical protein
MAHDDQLKEQVQSVKGSQRFDPKADRAGLQRLNRSL